LTDSPRFDLDHDLQPMALLGGRQDDVGVERSGAGANGSVLLGAGIDPDLETPPEFGPQLPNDAIVFQLFADRPHQNRAQRGLRELIKSRILARFSPSSTVRSSLTLSFVGYNDAMPGVVTERDALKILIVDDDEGVTQTFARMLRLEGYQVHTALNAEQGLGEAERTRPDAIILDLRMPLIDGLGFLRRLRGRDAQRATPVAIVTGDYFLDDSISSELRELGAQLRFKPLWLEDLVALARELLKVTN
jgi:CheY-like chemotaxis protein